jgi:hypothetical protein
MINRLGNSEPFFPNGTALSECAQLGMAHSKPGTREHGGKDELTEALAAPCSVKARYGLLKAVNSLTIVTLGVVDCADGLVRQRVQDNISASRGERQGALASGAGLVMCTPEEEMA